MNWTATVEEVLAEERVIFVSGVSSPYGELAGVEDPNPVDPLSSVP